MSNENLDQNHNSTRRIGCPVLVSEHLVLREPHVEDMDTMAKLANNRRVSSMLHDMPCPYTRRDAADFILRAVAGELGHCVFAITLAETGKFIGACSLQDREEAEGIEISYWLGQPYWGKGYATEAVNALIDVAFRATNIETLYVSCFAMNLPARRIIEKMGFTQFGVSERNSLASGLVLSDQFSLDRERWLGLRSLTA